MKESCAIMAAKTRFSDIEISITRLNEEDREELSSFSCGVDKLDDFFHNDIFLCSKYHYFSSYCARKVDTGEIIAIFTLSNDAMIIDNSDDKEEFIQQSSSRVNDEYIPIFRSQTSFPAINIGHLGVRKDMQSKGVGEQILDFVTNTFISYDITGCQFITVDSLNSEDKRANKFYSRYGFLYQTDTDIALPTRRMYLTLELYRIEA